MHLLKETAKKVPTQKKRRKLEVLAMGTTQAQAASSILGNEEMKGDDSDKDDGTMAGLKKGKRNRTAPSQLNS